MNPPEDSTLDRLRVIYSSMREEAELADRQEEKRRVPDEDAVVADLALLTGRYDPLTAARITFAGWKRPRSE